MILFFFLQVLKQGEEERKGEGGFGGERREEGGREGGRKGGNLKYKI